MLSTDPEQPMQLGAPGHLHHLTPHTQPIKTSTIPCRLPGQEQRPGKTQCFSKDTGLTVSYMEKPTCCLKPGQTNGVCSGERRPSPPWSPLHLSQLQWGSSGSHRRPGPLCRSHSELWQSQTARTSVQVPHEALGCPEGWAPCCVELWTPARIHHSGQWPRPCISFLPAPGRTSLNQKIATCSRELVRISIPPHFFVCGNRARENRDPAQDQDAHQRQQTAPQRPSIPIPKIHCQERTSRLCFWIQAAVQEAKPSLHRLPAGGLLVGKSPSPLLPKPLGSRARPACGLLPRESSRK